MMPNDDIHHMFNFTLTKTAAEIISKAKDKVSRLKSKIEERKKRVAGLRSEYGIDDSALVQLLTAARKQAHSQMFTYSVSNSNVGGHGTMEEKTIGAGVVNNLLTENDFIESERDQADRLEMIIRNLKPIPRYTADGQQYPSAEFQLSFSELEYLGF